MVYPLYLTEEELAATVDALQTATPEPHLQDETEAAKHKAIALYTVAMAHDNFQEAVDEYIDTHVDDDIFHFDID